MNLNLQVFIHKNTVPKSMEDKAYLIILGE